VFWEGDRHGDGVDEPSEDDFLGGPSIVALAEFLDGDWLLADGVNIIVGMED
jgi:hypothetical protein